MAEGYFKKSFQVLDMLIKKVCPIYQKYRTDNYFIIQSLSMREFYLTVWLSIPSEQYQTKKSYIVQPCKSIIVELDAYLQRFRDSIEINITVADTLISEQLRLQEVESNEKAVRRILKYNDDLLSGGSEGEGRGWLIGHTFLTSMSSTWNDFLK